MKWMPEGKSYLLYILLGLWVFLIAEYALYPLWLKVRVNDGLLKRYQTQCEEYHTKIKLLTTP